MFWICESSILVKFCLLHQRANLQWIINITELLQKHGHLQPISFQQAFHSTSNELLSQNMGSEIAKAISVICVPVLWFQLLLELFSFCLDFSFI